MKPSILVLTSSFPHREGDAAGGGPFVLRLSQELARHFRITVLCPRVSNSAREELIGPLSICRFCQNPWNVNVAGAPGLLETVRAKPWKIVLVPFFLAALVGSVLERLRTEPPDIVHAHWLFPQGFCAAIALGIHAFLERWNPRSGMKSLPRLVCTSHGSDLTTLAKGPTSYLVRVALARTDLLTCVSAPLAQTARDLGYRGPLEVIPMGIDISLFFPVNSSRSDEPARFIFVGNMVPPKGVAELVEAFRIVNEEHSASNPIHLTLVGDGPEKERLEARYRDEDGIFWIGRRSQSELPALLSGADAMIFPSHREGFPLAVAEAFACGVPVLTCPLPVFAPYETFGLPRIARIGDPAAVADALRAFLREKDHFLADREKYRSFVVERFAWPAIGDRHATCFRALL